MTRDQLAIGQQYAETLYWEMEQWGVFDPVVWIRAIRAKLREVGVTFD